VRAVQAVSGLWRWRGNPLRRTTDLVESWVALTALLLCLVAAPVIGAFTGAATEDALQRSVRQQRLSRYAVTATVVEELTRLSPDPDPEISTGRELRHRVLADWTAPDGTRHRGPVSTTLKSPRPGDRFRVWTDRRGHLVTAPLDSAAATSHAVLAGLGTAMLTAAAVEGLRRLIVWRLTRRRYARWDQAWERTGGDWGRTGTGS
jgi:hypothetical protein